MVTKLRLLTFAAIREIEDDGDDGDDGVWCLNVVIIALLYLCRWQQCMQLTAGEEGAA